MSDKKPPKYPYPPQYTVPSQAPSHHKAYDPRIQPDQYAGRDKRGAKPARFVPKGLEDTGDPYYQRSDEQRKRELERQNFSYLGPSPRSINQNANGTFALFSEDGTFQNIPGNEPFLLSANFPVTYDEETRTFVPDTTGGGIASNVTVTNAAGSAVFVQPGTGANFDVTISNALTSGIPIVNETGNVLDVALAGASAVEVNNAASNAVFVQPGTGANFDVSVTGTADVLVTNSGAAQAVPVEVVTGGALIQGYNSVGAGPNDVLLSEETYTDFGATGRRPLAVQTPVGEQVSFNIANPTLNQVLSSVSAPSGGFYLADILLSVIHTGATPAGGYIVGIRSIDGGGSPVSTLAEIPLVLGSLGGIDRVQIPVITAGEDQRGFEFFSPAAATLTIRGTYRVVPI